MKIGTLFVWGLGLMLLGSNVALAANASQKLQFSVMSKQSLMVTKLTSRQTFDHGLPLEKSVYLIRVRSNDAHKTWHVQSSAVDHGKPVLSGQLGEFTQTVEVSQPIGSRLNDPDFYLSSEV